MIPKSCKSGMSGLALCLALFSIHAGENVSDADFRELHEKLQPPKDEPWRTIPWQVSLLEARELAVKEKKPLVMRVRAGHPLGCV